MKLPKLTHSGTLTLYRKEQVDKTHLFQIRLMHDSMTWPLFYKLKTNVHTYVVSKKSW